MELDRTELFTQLVFKPVIRVDRGDEDVHVIAARTRRALEAAQKYSLVANSVKSEIVVEPQILVVDSASVTTVP
jgi:hypothetical protein